MYITATIMYNVIICFISCMYIYIINMHNPYKEAKYLYLKEIYKQIVEYTTLMFVLIRLIMIHVNSCTRQNVN